MRKARKKNRPLPLENFAQIRNIINFLLRLAVMSHIIHQQTIGL